MSAKKIDFEGINKVGWENLRSLCQQWLPGGKFSGAEYTALNPTRGDSKPGSFKINIGKGVWSDFATGDTGTDVVSLYAYLFTNNDQGAAAKALIEQFGLKSDKPTYSKNTESVKPEPSSGSDWSPIIVPDDAPPRHVAHLVRGRPETVWEYRDSEGKCVGYMFRFTNSEGGKEVLPLTFCENSKTGKQEWRWMGFKVPRYLFGLQYLAQKPDATVLLVEGEKCAAAAALALPEYACLTWPGGTKAVDKIDWSPLAGKRIIIWPDCDGQLDKDGELLPVEKQPGMAAAFKIENTLLLQGCDVSVLNIPAPGKKKSGWDVVDALEEGLTGELLTDWIVNNCPAKTPTSTTSNGGVAGVFEPIASAGHLLARYALVYGHGSVVFDYERHMLLRQSDMIDACISRDYAKQWQQSSQRKIVLIENVGFDPAGKDQKITCNLWSGWPTVPKRGDCTLLLRLIRYMCNTEDQETADDLFDWLIKWMAYPIQHPGAKMKSAVVVHGPQGTGKSIVFESLMELYGHYGGIIGQDAIDTQFNDWASKKLFLIADEVVARSDLYHIKNKLKSLITGDTIRINPKNVMAYDERNHVNLVFLSNERVPVVLEEDDRRHAVIWTPEKTNAAFYESVAKEKEQGGVAAFHHFLLNIDLGNFTEHTKPPMSLAKKELIDLSKDTISRFYEEWESGFIDGFTVMPVLSQDFYELYKVWCGKQGVKPGSLVKMVDMMIKRLHCKKERERYLGCKHPQTFIYADSCEDQPIGPSRAAYLEKCVVEFKELLGGYRGRNYN